MAKIIPINEHFQRFLAEMKDSFLGRSVRADAADLAAVFRTGVGAATGSLLRVGALRAATREAAGLPQRLLRAGFCDPLRNHSLAHRAHPRAEFFAGGAEALSAAGRRSVAADPRGVFAGNVDRARRKSRGHDHERNGYVIERCFVEVRRRTRPMVCFVNVESVDRIIYSIFQRFNLEWRTRTLNLFIQAA